jgi:hypothetical protein
MTNTKEIHFKNLNKQANNNIIRMKNLILKSKIRVLLTLIKQAMKISER